MAPAELVVTCLAEGIRPGVPSPCPAEFGQDDHD
jgi:hypothetical protein